MNFNVSKTLIHHFRNIGLQNITKWGKEIWKKKLTVKKYRYNKEITNDRNIKQRKKKDDVENHLLNTECLYKTKK